MLNHVPYEKLVERKGLSFHKLRKRNDRWTTTTTTTRTRQFPNRSRCEAARPRRLSSVARYVRVGGACRQARKSAVASTVGCLLNVGVRNGREKKKGKLKDRCYRCVDTLVVPSYIPSIVKTWKETEESRHGYFCATETAALCRFTFRHTYDTENSYRASRFPTGHARVRRNKIQR